MRVRIALSVALGALAIPATAPAHVTLNPREAEAEGFVRFALRVPNERDDASTTKVTVRFPEEIVSASFQNVPGWKRTVRMAKLDQPIEEEGEDPITERIATVTWSGGRIRPGEFEEFGISTQMPDKAGSSVAFPALQHYSGGEVVRWIGPEDADEPAPRVELTAAEEEEGDAAPAVTPAPAPAAATSDEGDEDGTGRANLALGFGIAGLVAGLGALALAFARPRRA